MPDISAAGTVVIIKASNTFPLGLTISQFADDSDPLDIGSIKIADTAMGLNGDLLRWSRAIPIPLTLNVIPETPDDTNLQILGDANRVGQGKVSARDAIDATVIYPDGNTVLLTGGILTDYMPGNSIASSMRLKTKTYMFQFENKV